MNIGRALAIWQNISTEDVDILEKGEAIKIVYDMATHNSVTKNSMLNIIGWLWDQIFIEAEVSDDGQM